MNMISRTASRLKRWWPAIVWMMLIFIVSAQPRLPGIEDELLDLLLKKGGHMLAYGILAGLIWRAVECDAGDTRTMGLVWLMTIAYATTDELHQLFVPGRHGSAVDVIIDGAGALIAILLLQQIVRRRQ